VGLVSLLNQRLYSICRVEIPSNELQTLEMKLNFVRSILSPQSIYRQTPEVRKYLFIIIYKYNQSDGPFVGLLDCGQWHRRFERA
jgi:hypothetical protein